MKYRYAIGQQVKVREDLEEGKEYSMFYGPNCNSPTTSMLKLAGTLVTIRSNYGGQYLIQEMGCFWTDEMFEDVELENLNHRLIGKQIIGIEETEDWPHRTEGFMRLDDGEVYQIILPFGVDTKLEHTYIVKLKRDFLWEEELVTIYLSSRDCCISLPLTKEQGHEI